MSLAGNLVIVSDGIRLVGFVECCKPEDINAPFEETAHGRVPICLHVLVACNGCSCVGASCAGPASFCYLSDEGSMLLSSAKLTSVHKMNAVQTASNILYTGQGQCHVLEKGLGCIFDVLVLPVGESVGKSMRKVSFVRVDQRAMGPTRDQCRCE